jgi:hypothetical protein
MCEIGGIMTRKYCKKKAPVIQVLLLKPIRSPFVDTYFQKLITTQKTANMIYSIYKRFEFGKEYKSICLELVPVGQQKI